MDTARVHSAYRLAIGIVLTSVLIHLAGRAALFGQLVYGNRAGRPVAQKKLTAGELESIVRTAKVFPAPGDVYCQPVTTTWDYVCYFPVGSTSAPRLKMGFRVDAHTWIDRSAPVPPEAQVPAQAIR